MISYLRSKFIIKVSKLLSIIGVFVLVFFASYHGMAAVRYQLFAGWPQDNITGFDEYSLAVDIDSSENVYITGSADIGFTRNWTRNIKYSPTGVQLQLTEHGDVSGNFTYTGDAITIGPSGNVYITGDRDNLNGYHTIKFDSNLGPGPNGLWATTHDPCTRFLGSNDLALDATESVLYVVGQAQVCSKPPGSDADILVLNYNTANGVLIDPAETLLYDNDRDSGNAIAVGPAGNLFIAGEVSDGIDVDWLIAKIDLSGPTPVPSTVQIVDSGLGWDHAEDILYDSNSGFLFVAGEVDNGAGKDVRVSKLDPATGAEQPGWPRIGDATGYVTRIAVDSFSNVYVGGNFTGADFGVLKYAQDGTFLGFVDVDPIGGSFNELEGVAVDGSDNIVVTGSHDPVPGQVDMRTSKHTSYCNGVGSLPGNTITWSDGQIVTAGTTKVRAQHINELRTWIDNRRNDALLSNYTWTNNPVVAQTTKIRHVHFTEMRTAIDNVYTTCGEVAPTWTNPVLDTTVPIRAIHMNELRDNTLNAP